MKKRVSNQKRATTTTMKATGRSSLAMMKTMMMSIAAGVIVRASGLSTIIAIRGAVRGGRVPVEPVILTMLGEDGVEADGRIPALLPCGLMKKTAIATSIGAIRVLFKR